MESKTKQYTEKRVMETNPSLPNYQIRKHQNNIEPAIKYRTTNEGILSFDARLNNIASIKKSINETYIVPEIRIMIRGRPYLKSISTKTMHKKEFRLHFDLKDYLTFTDYYQTPYNRDSSELDLVIQRYLNDPSDIKKLTVKKVVDIDIGKIINGLENIIRRCGYDQMLTSEFEIKTPKITIRPSTNKSHLMNSVIMKSLCCITCCLLPCCLLKANLTADHKYVVKAGYALSLPPHVYVALQGSFIHKFIKENFFKGNIVL